MNVTSGQRKTLAAEGWGDEWEPVIESPAGVIASDGGNHRGDSV